MSDVFINLLNLSIAASFLIVAVILVRFLLKGRAPSWVCCLLWGLVAVRLILPFTVESSFSLVPNQKLVISDTALSDESEPMTSVSDTSIGVVPDNSIPYEQSYVEPDKESEVSSDENVSENLNTDDDKDVSRLPVFVGDTDANNTPPEDGNGVGGDAAGTTDASGNTEGAKGISERTASVLGWIWLAGFILMTCYATVSCVLLKIRVSTAIPCGGGIRKGERVDSPFVLGVFSPHIYLPTGLSEETENCVIAHERAHIKRFDHLIKPFGFFLLALYWFNPLVWVAYVLLCRDIENACDEKVIKNLVPEDRKLYAKALLECSVSHKRIVACPVAFGETGVKERVKNTMSYKKPAFWIIICAVIICVAVAVFFMTTSSNGSDESSVPDSSNTESETESSDNESLNESEVSETESSDVSDEESIDENDSSNDEIYDENAAGKVYHGLFEAVEATSEGVEKLDNYISTVYDIEKKLKEWNLPTSPVIITPLKDITDVRTIRIECLDIASDGELEYRIRGTRYIYDKIEAGHSLVADFEMGELLPINAITFVDSDSNRHIYSVIESAYDGSLEFSKIALADWKYIIETKESEFPKKAAKGYDVIYTNPDKIDAVSCDTAPRSNSYGDSVTAVYDGSNTYFYNAFDGTYLHSEKGEWTFPCCGGFYNEDKSNWIGFELDKETDEFLHIIKDNGHAHGFGREYNFYIPSTGKTYSVFSDEGGATLYEGDGLFICIRPTDNGILEALNNPLNPSFPTEDGKYKFIIDSTGGEFDFWNVKGKYGLVDNGRIVIPFEYDYMESYDGWETNTVGVVLAVKDGRTYYFSTDGTNLTPDGFDCGSEPFNDRAWVFDDGQGYIIEFR